MDLYQAIFMHDGFENEMKDRPRTHQDTHQDKILEFCKEPKTTNDYTRETKYKKSKIYNK